MTVAAVLLLIAVSLLPGNHWRSEVRKGGGVWTRR